MQHIYNGTGRRRVVRVRMLLLAAVALWAAAARAQGYVVDQSHQPEIFGEWSIRSLAAVGQEFVPHRAWLNAVELWISHGAVFTEPPADVFVRVHESTIDGAIVGASAAVTVLDDHFAPVQFDFPAPIALTPGNTYVIEAAVIGAPGSGNPMVGGGDSPGYAAGRAVIAGTPQAGIDLWFRTGATAEVTAGAGSWGAIKGLYR